MIKMCSSVDYVRLWNEGEEEFSATLETGQALFNAYGTELAEIGRE